MQPGMIGLGRMGANTVRQLVRAGHECVVLDSSPDAVQALVRAQWPALGFFVLMCLSAVYLQHHYVTDVVLGCAYALAALATITALDRHLASAGSTTTRWLAGGAPT